MNRLVDEGRLSERDKQDEVCQVLQWGLTTTSIHPYFLQKYSISAPPTPAKLTWKALNHYFINFLSRSNIVMNNHLMGIFEIEVIILVHLEACIEGDNKEMSYTAWNKHQSRRILNAWKHTWTHDNKVLMNCLHSARGWGQSVVPWRHALNKHPWNKPMLQYFN